jgi:hypothetical protein
MEVYYNIQASAKNDSDLVTEFLEAVRRMQAMVCGKPQLPL